MLGTILRKEDWRAPVMANAHAKNGWFTPEQTAYALDAIAGWLTEQQLFDWVGQYRGQESPDGRKVGVVMAGNIPAVGFHDFLSVLISGHRLAAKLSSQDDVLIPALAQELLRINPRWSDRFEFNDKLTGCDAVIATGSNNSSRYFEYYFRHIPLLLRKSMSSLAVLDGSESIEQLEALGEDIFRFYGLGCRNVSKVLIPSDYDQDKLIGALYPFRWVLENHKYANAYTYQRALLLVDQQPFTDNGFCVFRESTLLHSPVSVLHIDRYKDLQDLHDRILFHRNDLQCLVGSAGLPEAISFGSTQNPGLSDYADRIDTMDFLARL